MSTAIGLWPFPQKRPGGAPESSDCKWNLPERAPIPMSTAVPNWPVPQNWPGGCPETSDYKVDILAGSNEHSSTNVASSPELAWRVRRRTRLQVYIPASPWCFWPNGQKRGLFPPEYGRSRGTAWERGKPKVSIRENCRERSKSLSNRQGLCSSRQFGRIDTVLATSDCSKGA